MLTSIVSAQSGVVIPLPGEKPNAAVLSLAVMNVDIEIDNQHAVVKVMQIFDNHTPGTLEGKYIFALPQAASVSDFAVWDGEVRIPGVMMEKPRAERIYAEIKSKRTDPGILQSTDDGDSSGSSGFTARIVPINAYGTKRLEMEYTEELPIDGLASHFTFPLKPANGEVQMAGEFNLKLRLVSDPPISPVLPDDSPFPLEIGKNPPGEFSAEFHASNFELRDDFAFDYSLAVDQSALSVIAHRMPEKVSAYDLRDPQSAKQSPDGFFQARAVFAAADTTKSPKRVVLLLDTSLSMYGDKLARAVEATDFFLHGLTADDEFNLLLFNEDVVGFESKPVAATADAVEAAMQFVKQSYLSGGTNVKKALEKSAEQAKLFTGGEPAVVMISDANPTLETTQIKTISAALDDSKARFFAFALGVDANESLLTELAGKTHGAVDRARETEDIGTKLRLFFDKVSTPDISDFQLSTPDAGNLHDVYPSGDNSYFGSSFTFVGRYIKPQDQTLTMTARSGISNISLSREISLPDLDAAHAQLPRVWARARVNALLRAMDRDGEREDLIAEIIRLSEEFKFVTPYTAFLAAPRALLRPRLIQPGDPMIRVRTDPSITAVFAVLPFGETMPLKFLPADGVWETRFLAPVWMADGTYSCRLLLTDKDGNGYQEQKTFVVDSRSPSVKIGLVKRSFNAGDDIAIKVSSDSDTSRLTARIYGAKPIELRWSGTEKANVGTLRIPDGLVSGRYKVTVSAEDFAHNQTTEETTIEVIGR